MSHWPRCELNWVEFISSQCFPHASSKQRHLATVNPLSHCRWFPMHSISLRMVPMACSQRAEFTHLRLFLQCPVLFLQAVSCSSEECRILIGWNVRFLQVLWLANAKEPRSNSPSLSLISMANSHEARQQHHLEPGI